MHELEERLARLERTVYWQRWALLAAGFVMLGVTLIGAGPGVADTVRARKFELVSSDGRVVGQFDDALDGIAQLRLTGPDQRHSVAVTAERDAAGLVVFSGVQPRAIIGTTPEGVAMFSLPNPRTGFTGLLFTIGRDGSPEIMMRGPSEEVLWRYPQQ